MLNQMLRACNGDAACESEARSLFFQVLVAIEDWYRAWAENDFRPNQETRDNLDRIQQLFDLFLNALRAAGIPVPVSMIFYDDLNNLTGNVDGEGELIMVTAVRIDINAIAVSGDDPASESVTTTEQAVSGVTEAAASSADGMVQVQQVTRLRGKFTVQIDSSSTFDPVSYEFNYNFSVDRYKTIDGFTVRTLPSGSAPITGTPLTLELDPVVARSQLILGNAGNGILRL